MENYYKLLDIDSKATEEDITVAQRKKLRVWRTRENAMDMDQRQEAEQMVKKLMAAKDTLLDAGKRAEYDQKLEAYVESPAESRIVPISGSAQELIDQGWQFLKRDDIPQALAAATQATQADPTSPQAWALLGQAKFRWKDYDDAIYEYKRAISFAPNQDRYYSDLGFVYMALERLDDALVQMKRAAQIAPDSVSHKASIGALYLSKAEYAEGIGILEQCLKQEPNNEGYRGLLAEGYAEMAYRNWFFLKDTKSYLPTKKIHITEAITYLERAEKVLGTGNSFAITKLKIQLELSTKRKFVGSKGMMIISGLLWSLLSGLGIVLAVLYYFACRIPMYSVHARILKGDKVFGSAMASGGWLGIVIGIAIFPITVVLNFIRNYTGENAIPALSWEPITDKVAK